MASGERGAGPQRGYAYLLLLVAVAVIGVAASSAVSLGAALARRDAEQQLLAIGSEFQQALRSYAGIPVNAPPTTALMLAPAPRTLDDLLKDPRSPSIRRHLRQLYFDPLTGKPEWGVVKDARGLIVGVYSLAEGQPIKRTDFDTYLPAAAFENADRYAHWVFGLPAAAAFRTP